MIQNNFDYPSNLIFLEIIPIVIISLSIMCSLISLIIYIKNENLRLGAGKIKFIIIFNELIFSILCLSSIFYNETIGDKFCLIFGIFTILTVYSIQYLNFFLSISLMFLIKFYYQKKFQGNKKLLVIIIMLFILLFSVLLIFLEEIKFGPLGLCWLSGSQTSELINLTSTILIYPLTIFSMIYISTNQNYKEKSYSFGKNYMFVNVGYIFIFTLTWIPANIVYFVDIWNQYNRFEKSSEIWNIFKQIAFLFLIISPLLMFMLRMKEKIFKNLFKNMIKAILLCLCYSSQEKKTREIIEDDEIDFQNFSHKRKLIAESKDEIKRSSSERQNFMAFNPSEKSILSSVPPKLQDNNNKQVYAKILLGLNLLFLNDKEKCFEIPEKSPPWEHYLYNEIELNNMKIVEIFEKIYEFEEKQTKEQLKNMIKLFENEKMACLYFGKTFFHKIRNLYKISIDNILNSIKLHKNKGVLDLLNNLRDNVDEILTEDEKYCVKIIEKRFKIFLKDKFFIDLHSFLFKNDYISLINPLLGLFSFQLNEKKNVGVIIFENPRKIHKKVRLELILTGKDVIAINFNKSQKIIEEKKHFIKAYKLEEIFKIKFKEKGRLMKILSNDTAFLIKTKSINYKIHFIFYENPNINESEKKEDKEINTNIPINCFQTTKNKYLCSIYITDFEENFEEEQLKVKKFNQENPEIYGNSLVEVIQEIFYF